MNNSNNRFQGIELDRQIAINSLSDDIRKYLQYLFKYITKKYCFTSGAFVIEDNDKQLYSLLIRYYRVAGFAPYISSHTRYRTNVTKGVKEVLFGDKTVVANCRDPTATMGGVTREFRMVKWYRFKKNGRSYIYLKPETTSGSNSREHVLAYMNSGRNQTNAVQAHVITQEEIDNDINEQSNEYNYRLYRREDCDKLQYRTTAPCRYNQPRDNTRPYEFYSNTLIDDKGNITDVNNIETYQRKGDEIFIPFEVNNYLLKLIFNNQNFGVDQLNADTGTIRIYTLPTTGGKHKTKKLRKHKTKKVRKYKTKTRSYK